MTYNLIVEEKIEVWVRSHVEVEADNIKSAINKCIDYDYEVISNEVLFDTEELLDPKREGKPTREIYLDKHTQIYTNNPVNDYR